MQQSGVTVPAKRTVRLIRELVICGECCWDEHCPEHGYRLACPHCDGTGIAEPIELREALQKKLAITP